MVLRLDRLQRASQQHAAILQRAVSCRVLPVYDTLYVIDAAHCRIRHVSSAGCDVFLLLYQFLRRLFCASFLYERQNRLLCLVPYVTCFVTQRALIQSPYWTVNNLCNGFRVV